MDDSLIARVGLGELQPGAGQPGSVPGLQRGRDPPPPLHLQGGVARLPSPRHHLTLRGHVQGNSYSSIQPSKHRMVLLLLPLYSNQFQNSFPPDKLEPWGQAQGIVTIDTY